MKNLRKIAVVCTFLFVVVAILGSVYGVSTNNLNTVLSGGNSSGEITGVAKDVWATIATIVQILAVVAVVFAGIRYMFASADAKADIKKQTVILIVGAVLVFGATAILKFVESATTQII